MLLNPRKRLKTLGFKQVNNSFPFIRPHPLLRASRELAREKSREDIGFWSVKDMASMGCRDVISQETCTLILAQNFIHDRRGCLRIGPKNKRQALESARRLLYT